jgi:hypothetical protein
MALHEQSVGKRNIAEDVMPRGRPFTPAEMDRLIEEAELRYRAEMDGRPLDRPRPPAGSAGDLTYIGLIGILGRALAQAVQTNIDAAANPTS